MTTDLELTELFKRKATEMGLSGGMSDNLRKRIKRRQLSVSAVAVAAVVALVFSAWGLSGALFAAEEIAPADRNAPVVEHPSLTANDLNGMWLLVENTTWPGLLVQFSSDGTFAIDDRGELTRIPAARGTFELDEDIIRFTSEGSDLCAEGDTWTWRATLPETGRLEIVHTEEAADPCRNPNGTEWTLARVSPASTATLGLTPSVSARGRPVTATEMAGIWFPVEAPGLAFSFTDDGSFTVDNEGQLATSPDVRGTHVIKGDRITFTIEAGGACSFGDGWTWRADLLEDGLLRIKSAREASGNCRVERGTEWTLIRLSPGSASSAEIEADR